LRTLEDTPFYNRNVVATQIGGERLTAMHESFDARRFAAPWVQALLPFRMPRRAN
jgi:carotenoid 1,2-hydratase